MVTYVMSGICGLAGGVMFLYVLKRFFETLAFIRSANKTLGKVIGYANARTSDHHVTYLPIFEFQINDGQRLQHTSTVASNPPAYKIGETRELLYMSRNPQTVRINSVAELWLTTLVLLLISLVLLGFALLAFFSGR